MPHASRTDLTSWSDIKSCLQSFGGDWLFRGHGDAAWTLQTTLERNAPGLPMELVEDLILQAFQRNAHNYLEMQHLPIDVLEWFALMQHHGAPTRLLDWSYSPYVACFFAIENALDPAGNCAVWAIDVAWCRTEGAKAVRKGMGGALKEFEAGSPIWREDEFKSIFVEKRVPLVLPAEPRRRNERLTIQNGTFLCPGDVRKGFLANLEGSGATEMEKHLVRISIPNRLRNEMLQDLNYMNINRATLFPGMDGFAQSLKHVALMLEPREISRRAARGKR